MRKSKKLAKPVVDGAAHGEFLGADNEGSGFGNGDGSGSGLLMGEGSGFGYYTGSNVIDRIEDDFEGSCKDLIRNYGYGHPEGKILNIKKISI